MDAEYAQKLLKECNYQAYGRHDLLFSLSCIFEDDCGDTEVIFAIPADWLQTWMLRNTGKYWSFEEIQKWLQETYTSEDSEDILKKAALENRIAFYNVDYHDVIPF